MKTKHLLALMVIVYATLVCSQTQNSNTCTILFEKNSYKLSSNYSSKLDSLIKVIKQSNSQEEIGINGYTDSDADDQFNIKLSENRAKAVKKYFKSKGISNTIHTSWKGEEQALNANVSEAEKTKNRRVEILRNYADYNDVFTSFKKNYQSYTIHPMRDTLLICSGGLQLEFKKGVLITSSSEPVTIKVQEYYSKGDFVLAGLTTQDSNNALLESGGMINIEAWQLDKKLEVRDGAQVGVIFKDRSQNDNMQLFNGSGPNGSISWLASVGSTVDETITHHPHMKEMMNMRYSTYDTCFVYSHQWEEGTKKIIKTSIKGIESIDTIADEQQRNTSFMLGTTKLGWINCDRFSNNFQPKTNLVVGFKSSIHPFVSLVFKDINSIMAANRQEMGRAVFSDIPMGKEVTVIGIYKALNKEKVLFAMQKTSSSSVNTVNLTFEELLPEEVKERLNDL
jgi:hypothetical protein